MPLRGTLSCAFGAALLQGPTRIVGVTGDLQLIAGRLYLNCLSYHGHPIRPCGAPSPLGEDYDARIPSSIKAAHHPCEPIRSPSTVIPSAVEGSLLHGRHIHTCPLTQTTPWCFLFRLSLAHGLPVCKKYPSTSVGMTGGRQIASHSFSNRFVNPFVSLL